MSDSSPSERKLINGAIGLTVGGLIRHSFTLISMLVAIVIVWQQLEARSTAHEVELRNIARGLEAQGERIARLAEAFASERSRVAVLDREVAAVRDQTAREIASEMRAMTIRLDGIRSEISTTNSRLDRIDAAVRASPQPTHPGQRQ